MGQLVHWQKIVNEIIPLSQTLKLDHEQTIELG